MINCLNEYKLHEYNFIIGFYTLGASGAWTAGGINDVGGGKAPFRNGSGGLGIPSADSSGKPGARKNIELAPPSFGASFI